MDTVALLYNSPTQLLCSILLNRPDPYFEYLECYEFGKEPLRAFLKHARDSATIQSAESNYDVCEGCFNEVIPGQPKLQRL